MPRLMGSVVEDPVVEEVEAIYGWCGLCHSFVEFPHQCPAKDCLAEEEGR